MLPRIGFFSCSFLSFEEHFYERLLLIKKSDLTFLKEDILLCDEMNNCEISFLLKFS